MLMGIQSKRDTDPFLVGAQTCIATMKAVWHFLRKLRIDVQDPATLLVDILMGILFYYRDTCSGMFITSLFVIARNRKQPRCLS